MDKTNIAGSNFKFNIGDVVYLQYCGREKEDIGLIVGILNEVRVQNFYSVLINSTTSYIHENNLNRI
jgi:hypothetical protein